MACCFVLVKCRRRAFDVIIIYIYTAINVVNESASVKFVTVHVVVGCERSRRTADDNGRRHAQSVLHEVVRQLSFAAARLDHHEDAVVDEAQREPDRVPSRGDQSLDHQELLQSGQLLAAQLEYVHEQGGQVALVRLPQVAQGAQRAHARGSQLGARHPQRGRCGRAHFL